MQYLKASVDGSRSSDLIGRKEPRVDAKPGNLDLRDPARPLTMTNCLVGKSESTIPSL